MTYYNEQLQKLKEQVTRKARLQNLLKDLREQKAELDKKVVRLEVIKEKELAEAVLAGRKALSTADSVLCELKSAKEWGTLDMFGGGIVTDMVKYNSVDKAQKLIEKLQVELRRFKTELADVNIQADMQVKVDSVLRFADYFLDGIFVDWEVYERIKESREKVQNTKQQTEELIGRLDSMLSGVKRDLERARTRLDDLVLNAHI